MTTDLDKVFTPEVQQAFTPLVILLAVAAAVLVFLAVRKVVVLVLGFTLGLLAITLLAAVLVATGTGVFLLIRNAFFSGT